MFPLIDTIFKFDLNIKKSIDLPLRLIAPIVYMDCEIWSTFPQHQINTMSTNPHMFGHYSINMNSEIMHPKFLKLIPGVKRNFPSLCALGETGELPLTIIAAIRMIKYWHTSFYKSSSLQTDNFIRLLSCEGRHHKCSFKIPQVSL